MDNSRSREALVQFQEYLGDKGLMAKATANARKAAVSQVLSILEDTEASDVTTINIDDVIARFGRLHGQRYTPASLNSYKSRLRSSIGDFRSYLGNPLAFRPSVQNRERPKSRGNGDSTQLPRPSAAEQRPELSRSGPLPMAAGNIIPIAIRADLTVYIQGLPFDLSEPEARKIAAVVTAMAQA